MGKHHTFTQPHLGEWLSQYRRAMQFGLSIPAMQPMDGADMRLALAQNDADYWSGLITKEEGNARAGAILAANAEHNGPRRTKADLRKAIIERDGDCCSICGHELGDDATIEHIQPLSRGGTWAFANLALAHAACNRLAGNAPASVKLAATALRGRAYMHDAAAVRAQMGEG